MQIKGNEAELNLKLKENMIHKDSCGFSMIDRNTTLYFFALDIFESDELFQMFQQFVADWLNVPVLYTKPIIFSDDNNFSAALNINIESGKTNYQFIFYGQKEKNEINKSFDCVPSFKEKLLLKKYIRLINCSIKKGCIQKASDAMV